jgi:hypothetical protein
MRITILSLLAFICFYQITFAQFEGVVTYEIKATGEMASQISGMIPTKQIVKVKGDKIRTITEGGIAPMDIIADTKTGTSIMIMHADKIFYNVPAPKEDKKNEPKPKVEKTDETATICGYKCQKYKIESENEMLGTTTTYIWATTDLKIDRGKAATSTNMEGVEGFPMKMMMDMGMFGMTFTVKTVEAKTLSADDFKSPKGYKEEKYDKEKLKAGLMGGLIKQ